MREVFDGYLCEKEYCEKELIDNDTPCCDCEYCVNAILSAEEKEAG